MNHMDFIEQCRAWAREAKTYAGDRYQGAGVLKYEQSAAVDFTYSLISLGAPIGNPEPIPLRKGD